MEPVTYETSSDWRSLANDLSKSLHLSAPPISITFLTEPLDTIPAFDEPMSQPSADGRAGRVPASCVFWIKATTATFTTSPEDHGNCSVGRYTHGLASFSEVADKSDIAALLESGWVDGAKVGTIPSISTRANAICYGPLADATLPPDVVLLRVNGRQLMVISDAVPGIQIEGKPQCHIVAIAKEHNKVAASVGCALSRARTGMSPDEMTVAIPGSRLASVVHEIQKTAMVDTVVAKYAADDARRFKVNQ
ncbi:MAG: DUF169 domain-containing protein [Actinomycetota bacterium]|nr:DUF169 domain-containing protein [Actinomycetota bacterium]